MSNMLGRYVEVLDRARCTRDTESDERSRAQRGRVVVGEVFLWRGKPCLLQHCSQLTGKRLVSFGLTQRVLYRTPLFYDLFSFFNTKLAWEDSDQNSQAAFQSIASFLTLQNSLAWKAPDGLSASGSSWVRKHMKAQMAQANAARGACLESEAKRSHWH